ncbi:hypothetical protein VCHC64A1_03224A, partial [Vibrio cholerae HC-64A1]
MFIGF